MKSRQYAVPVPWNWMVVEDKVTKTTTSRPICIRRTEYTDDQLQVRRTKLAKQFIVFQSEPAYISLYGKFEVFKLSGDITIDWGAFRH